MLNVGPLKSTELFISYLKATLLAVILIVSGWIKLTPQNTFVHDPQELKAPLVTDIQMLLRSLLCVSSTAVTGTCAAHLLAAPLSLSFPHKLSWLLLVVRVLGLLFRYSVLQRSFFIFFFNYLSEQRAASRLHPTPQGSLLSSALNFQFQQPYRMADLHVQRHLLSALPSWTCRCVTEC